MPPLWAKIDVGVLRHPKLFRRKSWEKTLWVGLILTAKEHFDETGVVRGYTPADYVRMFNLEANAGQVKKTLEYFASVGMLRTTKDGGLELKDYLQRQKDPTNALRQARFKARQRSEGNGAGNGPVTDEVTRGPLPEGEGEGDPDQDPSTSMGGDLEAPKTSPSPSLARKGKDQAQHASIADLEGSWPTATLKKLQARSSGQDWERFLRKAAPYPESVRVAAARKYLEHDRAKGKNLDYLVGTMRGMAAEGAGEDDQVDQDDEKQRLREREEQRRRRAELEASSNLTPEQRAANLARLRTIREDALKNGHGKVPNGLHKRSEGRT